jgi:hypothetical protein
MFCSNCGNQIALAGTGKGILLDPESQRQVDRQHRMAQLRTSFETAVVYVKSMVEATSLHRPSTFVSYAWNTPEQDAWVEKQLVGDLYTAGLPVIFDRWDNSAIGSDVVRFAEQIATADKIVVVGTPEYVDKYTKQKGNIVAAEVRMINQRLIGSTSQEATVLPLLLRGEPKESLPPLMQGMVWADFRSEEQYFAQVFDLILSLYGIPRHSTAVADLRALLDPKQAKES